MSLLTAVVLGVGMVAQVVPLVCCLWMRQRIHRLAWWLMTFAFAGMFLRRITSRWSVSGGHPEWVVTADTVALPVSISVALAVGLVVHLCHVAGGNAFKEKS